MELTVDDGKIVAVTGDGTASPYGAYLCPKGLASMEFHNGAENRLLGSLKRGPNGDFAEIGAERALDEIAARLKALIAEHGPRSVAVFHGTGAYHNVLAGLLEKSFLAAIGSPNLFSTMTIDQSAKWVTWGRMGTMASGKPSIRDIDLGVIVGNNPLGSHQTMPFAPGECGAPARALAEAKARGMRLIVVDPRRTETARFADLLIQPLPGQDAALFAAIAHILLRDGTCNAAFCARFVTQLDALRRAVAPFTPEFAAELGRLLAEPPDRRFGYRLTVRRVLEAMNSAYLGARRTARKYPVNWVHMHPDDVLKEGIAEGAAIELRSATGRVIGVAKAEDRMRRGVVSMTHMFGTLEPSTDPWTQGGSNAGALTSLERGLEPINFMPRFSGIPIDIRPCDGAGTPS
jgi:anaerobic selenocysteine-containing dehydrogenase